MNKDGWAMRLSVLGGGSFGMALATHYAVAGHEVLWWMRQSDATSDLVRTRQHPSFLPGVTVPDSVQITTDLSLLSATDIALVAVPAAAVQDVLSQWVALSAVLPTVVIAAKGIDPDTLELLPQTISRAVPKLHRVAYLSGPSFAAEVARSAPTSVVVASTQPDVLLHAQQMLTTKGIRCYSSSDVMGVELAGAMKNVYAIAAGIIDGVGYGLNARAALITRAINEMTQLGWSLGANPLTMAGLAGIGDLVLTCTGDLSRNRKLGLLLGQGRTLQQAMDEVVMVAEGVRTAKAVAALGRKLGVELPIAAHMAKVLFEGMSVKAALTALAERELKPEWPEALVQLTRRGL